MALAFTDIPALFKAAFFCYGENGRLGLPLFLVSPPGESKTSLARQLSRQVQCWFGALEGSRLDAVDVAGLPNFSADRRSYTFVPPQILRDAEVAPAGLLFLDELTRAPASVQAAFLTLLLEGRTEGVQLPKTTRIFAAANPAAQVGGVDLDPANASRLVWVRWPEMTADNFSSYLLAADARTGEAAAKPIDYAAEMARLEDQWEPAIASARAAVAGFLSAQGSRIRESSPDEARAWANPRTWSMATRALAAARMHGVNHEVTYALVAGCIGEGVTTAFLTWLKAQDLPRAADVLAGRVALPTDKKRPDQTLAVLAECIAVADESHKERVWELIGDTATANYELAAVGIRMLHARKAACPYFFASGNKAIMKVLSDKNLQQIVSLLTPGN